MQQVFVEKEVFLNDLVEFTRDQAHHLSTVLRMRDGEKIRIVDQQASIFLAELKFCGKKVLARCVEKIEENPESAITITLLMGLIKKEKWDYCLQKSTELGVSRIIPFESSRTIVKAKEEKGTRKKERWEKILCEAAQQCKRSRIPEIIDPLPLSLAAEKGRSDLNFVAYEAALKASRTLRESLRPASSITIVIGPEGGFSTEEIAILKEKGYECITLGKRILRAETAALYALSAIDAILE